MRGSDARALSRSLLDLCRMRKLTIATAESCTGGLVAGALTDIPGSSDVIDRGFVTYSNDAKRAMLGVKATTLATFGAVSKETATAMAIGALEKAGVDLAVSITGIAGPGGARPGKPVGLVHFAVAARDGRILHRECRFGAVGRSAVRHRSVVEALRGRTEGKYVLLVRAKVARDVLPNELRRAGADVDVVEAYETHIPKGAAADLKRAFGPRVKPHIVTFTSSSTALNFISLLGRTAPRMLAGVCLASIGPVTSATLRQLGFPPTIEAAEYTMEGLVKKISKVKF